MNKKTYHIALICDDNYVMPTLITLKSLDKNINNMNARYIAHICSNNISVENQEIIRNENFQNIIIEINLISLNKTYLDQINQKSHVTSTALIKFELPNIFLEVDKLLYIDSDIIVKKDISEIFEINIDSYYLAAVFEMWKYLAKYYEYNNSTVDIDFYFNSGVMLMNLKKLRQDSITNILWKSKLNQHNNINTGFSLMDQDVFNEVCGKKTLPLSIKFNCDVRFTQSEDISLINEVFKTNYKNNAELYKDAIVLHYIGKDDKPWKYRNANCIEIWDKYYDYTSYSNQKLKRTKMKNKYISKFLSSLKSRGLTKTIRYIYEKQFKNHKGVN